MTNLTRSECRRYFKDCMLSYDLLDDADIASLHLMLNATMKKCRKHPTGSYHGRWKMSRKIVVKHDTHGRMKEAYLRCIIQPGSERECISFNRDGFIGFCGDFDDKNAEPILMAFIKWCKLTSEALYGEGQ